jgi:hypothetical protein
MERLAPTFASFLSIIGIASLWPFSGGEDVANARENILLGEKTDFWGGFAQFFYSAFKMEEPIWHVSLGITHACFILIGTIISLRTLNLTERSKSYFYFLFTLHYFATIYVLHLSRDGTLLAFAWLGVSLIFNTLCSKTFRSAKLTIAIIFVIVGLSFRPWLAISFTPLIIVVLYRSGKLTPNRSRILVLIISFFALVTGPLILDLGSKKLMNLKDSYPEQQVMILDMASLACLSPDKSTQNSALSALQPISTSTYLDRTRLCGQFYPQSWASLVFYSNPNDPAIRMITTNESNTYKSIRNSWIDLITSKPTQYLQIKIFQVSQLFLAGDSSKKFPTNLREFLLLYYEIAKALRIFSFLPILLLFSWLTFSARIQIDLRVRYAILSTYLLAIGTVTVAFVGDNQRYISWLAMLLLFAFLSAPRQLQRDPVS